MSYDLNTQNLRDYHINTIILLSFNRGKTYEKENIRKIKI